MQQVQVPQQAEQHLHVGQVKQVQLVRQVHQAPLAQEPLQEQQDLLLLVMQEIPEVLHRQLTHHQYKYIPLKS